MEGEGEGEREREGREGKGYVETVLVQLQPQAAITYLLF